MYEVSEDYVRAALALQGVPVPEDEIRNVYLRLSLWMKALNEIEAVIGPQMDDVDPIPPVYPHEEF
ncbi:hypothetical protein MKI84_06575 [Ancylobacter sp. A5.8]|uniref:hypothetical protein n=1 Tax=Ancylobacter gelatini TaxID=2919920 RepID=UPI001F4E85E9|nr:hypothetical protein [Ancylobacter gelatini]MCJ8142578.1 hypothetical protein [Ancylobacter gelatini]